MDKTVVEWIPEEKMTIAVDRIGSAVDSEATGWRATPADIDTCRRGQRATSGSRIFVFRGTYFAGTVADGRCSLSVAAFPPGEVAQRAEEVDAAERWPVHIDEGVFGVRGLPQHEPRQPGFARSAQDEVGIRQV